MIMGSLRNSAQPPPHSLEAVDIFKLADNTMKPISVLLTQSVTVHRAVSLPQQRPRWLPRRLPCVAPRSRLRRVCSQLHVFRRKSRIVGSCMRRLEGECIRSSRISLPPGERELWDLDNGRKTKYPTCNMNYYGNFRDRTPRYTQVFYLVV